MSYLFQMVVSVTTSISVVAGITSILLLVCLLRRFRNRKTDMRRQDGLLKSILSLRSGSAKEQELCHRETMPLNGFNLVENPTYLKKHETEPSTG